MPGGPNATLTAHSSRAVDDVLSVSSSVKVDTPYYGGIGPREGAVISGGRELHFNGRGIDLDFPRCSAYSAVPCRLILRATTRRGGRRVAAIRPRTIELAPGKLKWIGGAYCR